MTDTWRKSEKGRARRLFDKFRKRWRDKGYTVKISASEFYEFFIPIDCCQKCGRRFGKERKNVKSVRVFDVKNQIIFIENLCVMHFSCGCERNRYKV